MTAPSPKVLYENLKAFGLTRSQVRNLLPSWWSPEMEKHPDGVTELCMLISRRLCLDFSALLRGEVRRNASAFALAYKHSAAASPESLQGATSIALSLADAISASMTGMAISLPGTSAAFTKRVRAQRDGIVSLESLITTCWASGIPVVPMPNLPVGVRKMDGAVIRVGSRPVILISKKRPSRAWLAFILAHEIGHIGCGHLEKTGSIIDVSLQEQATFEAESSGDKQESEADEYALNLLGGKAADDLVSTWSSRMSPVELAVRAREAHANLYTESGHLVLRYAFKTKRWPDSMTAMNFLSEDANGNEVMQQALTNNLDLERIADDLRDLVVQITGIELPVGL